jgi:hypothetical protein
MVHCRQAGWPGRAAGDRLVPFFGGAGFGKGGGIAGGGVASRVTCRAGAGLTVGIASGAINKSRNSG